MQANAVVFTAPEVVEYTSVACPEPGPEDVVVRVSHSWISNGTEGSFLRGERIAGDTACRPGDPVPFPIVAGYQKVGSVEWVGRNVDGFAVGETVFCTLSRINGMFDSRAGHVSPAITPSGEVWHIPAGVDPLACSGLVLTQVGYNCGARPRIAVGDVAVVVGDGLVGLWAAETLSLRGARVILAGRHRDRLDRFNPGYGRETVDTTRIDLPAYLGEHHSEGVQTLVDTIGSITTVEQLLPSMKRFGHIVSAGFYGTDDLLPLQTYRDAELAIDLVSGWTRQRMDQTLELVSQGSIPTLPYITHQFPVDQASTAWDYIRNKRDHALGVVLTWAT